MLFRMLLVIWSSLLLTGIAFADDSDDSDIIDSPEGEATADTAPVDMEISAAGPHYLGDSGTLGTYFGTGDDLATTTVDGMPLTTSHRAAGDEIYGGEQVYTPADAADGAYSADNVYGPMWGVPTGVESLEGSQGYYFYELYQLYQEDPSQLTDAQYAELDSWMTQHDMSLEAGVSTAAPAAESTAAPAAEPAPEQSSSDEPAEESQQEGIEIGNVD